MFTSRTATKLVGFAVSTFSHLPGLLYDSNETFTSTMSISGENADEFPALQKNGVLENLPFLADLLADLPMGKPSINGLRAAAAARADAAEVLLRRPLENSLPAVKSPKSSHLPRRWVGAKIMGCLGFPKPLPSSRGKPVSSPCRMQELGEGSPKMLY